MRPPPRFPGHQARQVAGLRVLVTGGSGFIGSRVAGELCQAGAQVLSVDRRPPPHGFPPSCRTEACDIRAPRLAALAAAFAPHVVVHLAAHVSVPESARRPAADADVNVRGTVTVAEAAAAAGAELLVFAASCAVYGPPARLPVGEDHPLAPVTPYGLSKAAALGYTEWFARHRGLPATSLILGNVYGPAGPARGDGGVISQFLAAAADQRAPALHGDGRATRDFVHLSDVADAVLRACTAPAAGRVNIGSGTETSIADVQAIVSQAAGQTIPPDRRDARPGDIQRMCLRIDRAAARLGWTPQTSLTEGIAALIPARLAP